MPMVLGSPYNLISLALVPKDNVSLDVPDVMTPAQHQHFPNHRSKTLLLHTKATKMKTPCRELRIMKTYQRAETSARAATKPKSQVRPSNVDIWRENKTANTYLKVYRSSEHMSCTMHK